MMNPPPPGTMVTAPDKYEDLVLFDVEEDEEFGYLQLKYTGLSLGCGHYGIVVKQEEVQIPGNRGRYVWILLSADSRQYLVPLEHLKKVK